MRYSKTIFIVALAFGAVSLAQSPDNPASTSGGANASASQSGASTQGSVQLEPETAIRATLQRSVDTKHAKAGDEVVAKATQDVKAGGHVVIAKGSHLIGHITEANSRDASNGGSTLGIIFDKAISKGQEVPLHAAIQGVAAVENNVAAADLNGGSELGGAGPGAGAPGSIGARSNGGALGNPAGGVGAAGRTAGTTGNTAGDPGRQPEGQTGNIAGNAGGAVNAGTTGVVGMNGVTLRSASDARNGTVLTSTDKNIHLDNGTRLVLVNGAPANNQ